ncbi:MAG TPA: cytochrome o ubiquinol oxidase subunit IV [Candidatus Saccharimonadales bacterium]|nr:cytochrome o ubiquinol oxidase subunit IV [Candidatus Saccharimonadales bacterium]
MEVANHPGVNLKNYLIGFTGSLALTLASYFVVANHLLSNPLAILTIFSFAFLQFSVQLIFFLHLGKETNPRWKLAIFLYTASIVLLVMLGSLWIMSHLSYHLNSHQINNYIMRDEQFKK